MMDHICRQCNKSFVRPYSAKFCGKECHSASMMMGNKICPVCGEEFKPERNRSKYCSLTCFGKTAGGIRDQQEPPPVVGARWVPLTQGKFALVDESLFEQISKYKWHVSGNKNKSYAKRSSQEGETKSHEYMHNFILNTPDGYYGDHRNGDTLDNRSQNLRVVSRSQNATNSFKSVGKYGYRGVTYFQGSYVAKFTHNSKTYYLGRFSTAEDAARAYDEKARELAGDIARFNFPKSCESSAIEAPKTLEVFNIYSPPTTKFLTPKHTEKTKKKRSKPIKSMACKQCQKPLTKPGVFCSKDCHTESMKLPEKPCPICNTSFRPEKSTQSYCSLTCFGKVSADSRDQQEPLPIDGCKWVPLTQGKFALIDDNEFEEISNFSWVAVKTGKHYYAKRTDYSVSPKRSIYMHTQILKTPNGSMCDHINGDGLDNRRSNLRPATNSQNIMNTSMIGIIKYKGVIETGSSYQARLMANGNIHHIGTFNTAEDAARAYDEKARELHGEFGRYNFPRPGEMSAINGVQSVKIKDLSPTLPARVNNKRIE